MFVYKKFWRSLYMEDWLHFFLKFVLLIARLLRELESWARKPVTTLIWWLFITPTEHPRSVSNRCVIEHFGCLFVLTLFFFYFPLVYKILSYDWVSSLPFFSLTSYQNVALGIIISFEKQGWESIVWWTRTLIIELVLVQNAQKHEREKSAKSVHQKADGQTGKKKLDFQNAVAGKWKISKNFKMPNHIHFCPFKIIEYVLSKFSSTKESGCHTR